MWRRAVTMVRDVAASQRVDVAVSCDDGRRDLDVVDVVAGVDAPEHADVVDVDDFQGSVQGGPRGPCRVATGDPLPLEDLVQMVDPHHDALS